jgi:predicted AAA+ superfamily ATPase
MDTLSLLLEEIRQLNATLARWAPREPLTPDFASSSAYRWVGATSTSPGQLTALPLRGYYGLCDLKGIDRQKEALDLNTRQFLKGHPANNALLWGSRGTGKSTLVKALLHEYQAKGLRMIEVDRAHLVDLPAIQRQIQSRPERFIVYCDDLAFESDDAGYKTLKAALEGSLSEQPENLLIYATSNRRHLLPEYAEDNQSARWIEGELHQGEAVEEKISLSERFGVWLSFHPFNQDQYLEIVRHWLQRHECPNDFEVARTEALAYALLRGSRSGRVAYQFAKTWAGRKLLNAESDHP